MIAPSPLIPRKLRRGDTIRVVAPALSRAFVAEHDHSAIIDACFAALGLRLTFGDHVDQRDDFGSSSVASRVADLHAANPKIFCGYSDITAVQNAILARAGLVTYSGPHWSSFGMRDHFEQILSWFTGALFGDGTSHLRSALEWTDDLWFVDQDNRTVRAGEGWWPLAPGQAAGRVVGGNLCTLNLLPGTEHMPSSRSSPARIAWPACPCWATSTSATPARSPPSRSAAGRA